MQRKNSRRQKKVSPTFQKTGMVALVSLIFVSLAAAYQSSAGQSLFHAIQNSSTQKMAAGKILDKDTDFDVHSPHAAGGALKPEEEEKGGDDSLKFKKHAYAFRAYPNKTIPAGSRERAWEQFQQHYPPGQKKSLWKPVKQVAKP
jgi:hypothetical protein